MIKAHGLTHQGNVRSTNEDAMTWDVAIGFVAIADGMGGHQAGEVASSVALESILNFMRKSAVTDDFTWPFGVDPGAVADREPPDHRAQNRQSPRVQTVRGGARLYRDGHHRRGAGGGRFDGHLRQRRRQPDVLVPRWTPGAAHTRRFVAGDDVGGGRRRRRDAARAPASQRADQCDRRQARIAGPRRRDDARPGDCCCSARTACTARSRTRRWRPFSRRPPIHRAAVQSLVRAALDAGGKDNITVVLVSHDGAALAVA